MNTWHQWEDKNFNGNYVGICKVVFLHFTPKVDSTFRSGWNASGFGGLEEYQNPDYKIYMGQ